MYSTGNATRDEYISEAIKLLQEKGIEVTLRSVADCLDPAFELDAAELAGIQGNLSSAQLRVNPPASNVAEQQQEPEPVEHRPGYDAVHPDPMIRHRIPKPIEPRANETAPSHIDPPKAAPRLDYDTAMNQLRAAQDQLAESRRQVRALSAVANEKRGKLNEAIAVYQTGGQEGTAEERRMANIRATLATSQANRARKMESIPAELRGRYGSAAQFVRKQRQTPPSYDVHGRSTPGDPSTLRKGESRGAFPASMRILLGAKV